jgi:hypothetical protein
MAVENKWVNADVEAGKKGNPALIMPGQVFGFACTFEVVAADDDGSVFKLAKLGANMIPVSLTWNSDAITGFTSADLGLYKEDGTEADKNLFMAAHDVNGGFARGSELNGLHDLAIENIGKKLYELLGLTVATRSQDAYILAMTANTIGSGAGTVSITGTFLQG